MRLRSLLLVLALLCCLTSLASAENYATPSWPHLVQTMVRFNSLSLSDTPVLDEYLNITECPLYEAFYQDDFKWNQVRQAALKSIQLNVATYPMNYHYDTQVQLDRYDFTQRVFKFTAKSTLRNANAFQIFSVEGNNCGKAKIDIIPRVFKVVIPTPIYMDGIPLAENDAKELAERLEKAQNLDRIIFIRFNLRIVFVEPLRKAIVGPEGMTHTVYAQSNAINQWSVRLDGQLDSIDFFDDASMTHLIYRYQP